MYESFSLRNFRGFSSLEITGLKRINLITGRNNSGKTSVLEALFIHCGVSNPELTLRVNSIRGDVLAETESSVNDESYWDSLFYNLNASKRIELEGSNCLVSLKVIKEVEEMNRARNYIMHKTGAYEKYTPIDRPNNTLEISVREGVREDKKYFLTVMDDMSHIILPPPPKAKIPAIFLHGKTSGNVERKEAGSRFGRIKVQKKENLLLKALRIIEPNLKEVATIPKGKENVLYGDIGQPRMLPLSLMGAGMVKLATFVLAILDAPNGVVLIDEIENGFHHSILPSLWQVIDEISAVSNTQIFATTHSFENIKAAHSVLAKEGAYDFQFVRIESDSNDDLAVSYSKEALDSAFEYNLEVR